MATTPRPYIWREAELINSSADETGATFHFYDTQAEMIYPNSGLKYKYGEVPSGHWEDLELSDEDMLESTAYIFVKGDHPATGSLYLIALDRTSSKDTLYLFRYDYERDVSELVESATLTLQSDNPIAQIAANVKNVKDALFISESSLFTPTAKMLLGIAYGPSMVYTLATGYLDEVEWKHGARTVSLSGRNTVGYFLNSQTFDEDKSYSGTAVSVLTDIFDRFGITAYEIDDSDSKTITFDVSANDTGLKAVQIVSDLMTDILQDKIWDIEELYDGTVISGFDAFRGNYNPKGFYVFHGKSDVFTRKINRSIDGSYSHVRVTGTDKSGYDLTPAITEITTWEYWKPATHRTYHAPKVDGLASSEELAKYCGILAAQLQKSGQTVAYQTTLKPQLLVGDVAQIQGQEGEENETLGIITEVKHSFGEKGYMTEFTAASGGIINTIGSNTYTKKKSVGGTDRSRRLSDFMSGGDETMIPTQESNNPYEPQPRVEQYDFAHFDGSGYIELPIKVSSINYQHSFEIEFSLDKYAENMAVFGNSNGDNYAHLTTGYISDLRWYSSDGLHSNYFTAPFTGDLKFEVNSENSNKLYMWYGGERHEVGNYGPCAYDYRIWIGGRAGASNFVGCIKSVRLINLSTNTPEMELKPARYFATDGSVIQDGLYDTVSGEWYTCNGLTVDKPYIKLFNYAHFNGRGHFRIPFNIVTFYKLTVEFESDEMTADMAVFGNGYGVDYACLATGATTDDWITSKGAEQTTFTTDISDPSIIFILNQADDTPYGGKNCMIYDHHNHDVSYYVAIGAQAYYWIGGCYGKGDFVGKFKRLTITDTRDDSTVANILPAERYSATGRLLNTGMYDTINDEWYTCAGMSVQN